MCLALFSIGPAELRTAASDQPIEESVMGKYFLAWLLGVPAFVLVIIYLLFN
jgi:hypothetical protein